MRSRRQTLAVGLLAALIHNAAHAELSDNAKALSEQGRYWQARKDTARATEAWQKLLLIKPQQRDALFNLGLIELDSKRPEGARRYLQQLQQAHPKAPQAVLLEQEIRLYGEANRERLDQARMALDSGEAAQAVTHFRALLDGQPPQGDLALEFYGVLGYTDGGFQEARQGLERVLAQEPGNPRTKLILAKLLLSQESTRVDGLQRLANLRDDPVVGGQAVEAWRQGLPWMGGGKPAIPLYEAYLKVFPDDTEIREQLQTALSQNPAQRAPARAPARAQASAPTPVPAPVNTYWNLLEEASRARQAGNVQKARALLEELVRKDPANIWGNTELAGIYLQDGSTDKARQTMAALLQAKPDDAEALYASALFAARQGQWPQAQQLLARIPTGQRTAEMQTLADDIGLRLLVDQVQTLGKQGKRAQAFALLRQAEGDTVGNPELQATFANAYLELGYDDRALTLLRSAIAQSSNPSPALRIAYAGALLRAGDDAKVSQVLRELRGAPLTPAEQRSHADLMFQYNVRQADLLREQGDLAAAYDALAPALAERPQDPQAVSSLARMYLDHRTPQKAVELYQPLLVAHPDNADVQMGAAQAFQQNGDSGKAEKAIERGLQLAPDNPQVLSAAAAWYRSRGKLAMAEKLYAQALALQAPEPVVADNPFRKPVAANPFAPAKPAPEAAVQRELNAVREARSPQIKQGLTVRSNNGESGLSKITDVQAPLEISFPVNDDRMAVRVTPVSLNAGGVGTSSQSNQRFGGFTAAQAEAAQATPVETMDAFIAGGPGAQKDQGVGLAVAYEMPSVGVKTDLGTTPVGFNETNVVGGVSVDRPFTETSNARYNVNLSRRAVTDSLVSFAGAEDARTGVAWGGVTSNGLRGQVSYDNQRFGAYAYAGWHTLEGHNVDDNSRTELGSGIYWYLLNDDDERLTLGLGMSGASYANNQSFFTYGHGGYFSPQSFFSIGIPVSWAQRGPDWSYQVQGSVGVQHIEQDSAPYYRDKATQRAFENIAAQNTGRTLDTRYEAQNKTGVGYSLAATGEYRLGGGFFFGGTLGVDNARDYRQFAGGLYLRYLFQDAGGAMPLPLSPYRSPYSN